MPEQPYVPVENRLSGLIGPDAASAERALKNFRYIVGSVNESALKAWADIWKELQSGVAANGAVLPQTQGSFAPECGWAEFLEKFWLMKHYLDYIHGLCRGEQ